MANAEADSEGCANPNDEPVIRMNMNRTRMLLENIIRYPGLFAFLLRGFIKRQRVLVYPVERVFLAENLGKDDRLYALDAFPPRRSSARREMPQNSSLSANWICRDVVAVAVMTPPEGLYSVPWKRTSFGYEKLG